MDERALILFDTAIGRCGLVWGSDGIVAVQLPEATPARTRDRLLRAVPDAREDVAPPAAARAAVARIVALLDGEPDDLADLPVVLDHVAPFNRAVYDVARTVPPGATITYGEVADRIGADRAASRAVGAALGANPIPIVVPCHRVTAAGGKTGGFSAGGGVATKLAMLDIERAHAAAHGPPSLF